MMEFTKQDAEALATMDPDYVVRVIRRRHPSQMDRYGVWDTQSDHWVEFDFPLRGVQR